MSLFDWWTDLFVVESHRHLLVDRKFRFDQENLVLFFALIASVVMIKDQYCEWFWFDELEIKHFQESIKEKKQFQLTCYSPSKFDYSMITIKKKTSF